MFPAVPIRGPQSAGMCNSGLSVIGGLDYWNGLLEWTTGMDFDLSFFIFLFPPSANYIH